MDQKQNMPSLNLPAAGLKFRWMNNGRIDVFDPLRNRWVCLTPEEWVRQHFTAWLSQYRGYSPHRMANEISISLNDTVRRCDTVVYGNDASPIMIVEYKAPSVKITQKTFDQILRYNIVLQVPLLVVSNGIRHICCAVNNSTGDFCFLPDVPRYEELVSYTK